MKLMPFVRRYIPRTTTMVEEPGYHLEPDHVVCPHCEQIYCTEGIDDIALELDCCPAEKCKLRAIEQLGDLVDRWRDAEATLQIVADMKPMKNPIPAVLVLGNLQVDARRILRRCELCNTRYPARGRKACAECRAILRGARDMEGFNG